jgi:glycosyltransferase involved in cell wall biosynthesis
MPSVNVKLRLDGSQAVKVLLVTMYWPPAGGVGVQRPLKFATHLPALGIETHVLAPHDPKWIHVDEELQAPTQAWVHRARYVGPRGRLPAEELHGAGALERAAKMALLTYRRVLVPDENVTWNATAIPTAIRIVRSEGIDAVVTTSPPNSVHLIGAAVKRATGVRWVADVRDSMTQNADRRIESIAVRAKEKTQGAVARLIARYADATVALTDFIADEFRGYEPKGRLEVIANGADFDEFAGLEHHVSERFRITHTGAFFGKRDPRPFLTAFARANLPDAVVRFVGDFRAADREWAEGLGLGDRLELHPYVPRRRSLAFQRDSEALLLLLPDVPGRGAVVPSGKVFEYLAAERPILAAVPPQGAAAGLVREAGAGVVVAPDDVDAIERALRELHERWRGGALNGTPLAPELRQRLDRRARAEELAHLLLSLP